MTAQEWATQSAETQPLPRSKTEFALALECAYLAGQIQAVNEETKRLREIAPPQSDIGGRAMSIVPDPEQNVFFAEPEPEEAPVQGANADGDAANGALVAFLLLTLAVGASVVMYEAGKALLAFWVVRGWLN